MKSGSAKLCIAQPERPNAPSSIDIVRAALIVVAGVLIWLQLMDWIGSETWTFGRITFFRLVALAALPLSAAFLRPLVRLGRGAIVVASASSLILLVCLVRFGLGLGTELERPENQDWLIDIGANTYVAGGLLLDGRNPYAHPAQIWHRVEVSEDVQYSDGQLEMFGVPYDYGYPYFPAMLLSYLPFRHLADGYHSIRIANFGFALVTRLGAAWLAARLVGPKSAWAAASLTGVLYLGTGVLVQELFGLGVTDVVIAAWAVLGFLAASYGRFTLAGVLLGVAQACKLLPGPALLLPLLLYLGWGRASARVLLAYALTAIGLLAPFVIVDLERFVSATILFYFTNHAGGDNTSLWFFLSPALRPWFTVAGGCLTLAILFLARWRRDLGLAWPLALAFSSYFVFVAFNRMTHLNYLWGVYSLGCAAFVALLLGRHSSESDSRSEAG